MTEFLDFRVDLTLKDGTKSTGVISHVDRQQIILTNAIRSPFPEQILSNLNINSSQIADLKVIQLPPDFKSRYSQKSRQFIDDAIIFSSKPNTPRANTPKLKHQKFASSTTGNGDNHQPDWDNSSEVQDIKSLNDFDFQANLAMFDKKSVFADFQKRDNTNITDRLVGHNKLENVQKFNNNNNTKKEKYDNNEMVLESNRLDNWDNIGTVTAASTTNASGINTTANSKTGTPIIHQQHPSHKEPAPQNFKLINPLNLDPIPLASPVQLLEIERLATDTFGITSAMMAEICAINLSQLMMESTLGGAFRLSNKKNHNLPPLVLLLIGSGRGGSRAFATGRHLTNHGVRVLAFMINTDDMDPDLQQQWKLFELSGGKVVIGEIGELLDIIQNQLDTPVEVIVDALQGYDDHLEDIFYEEKDQMVLRKLIKWCNEPQQSNKIMSLDIPSGIDGGSGTLSDDEMKLTCRWCISMGLPLSGILLAYKNGNISTVNDHEVIHYVIDVGIPNKVYNSKPNLRKFDKFWFSSEASVKLEIESS
ncbi:EDC3 Enhancer of mRNA-decapping protein 3 [Candida maltosa Xu316]